MRFIGFIPTPLSKIGRGVWQMMQSCWLKRAVARRTSSSVKARPCVLCSCSAYWLGWHFAQKALCITSGP
jgi:hypothetical protein